jgi:ATP-dependent DNA helicase RecG
MRGSPVAKDARPSRRVNVPPVARAAGASSTRIVSAATLRRAVALGEDSTRQFKRDVTNVDALAAELVAFANGDGGVLYVGVADDGTIEGLEPSDVRRVNQLVGNTAAQAVRSPLAVHTQNVAVARGRVVVVVAVPKGLDKPYFDKNGVIWLKAGADKRRVNSKEELRRLFQLTDQFHADELPTKAGLDAIDELRFRDFVRDQYGLKLPARAPDRRRLLVNMNLATEEGRLNLAGLLLFGEQPQRSKPAFVVKAVAFPGTAIHASSYDDTEDFGGPLGRVFEAALAFVLRNLRKVQGGRGVNSPGVSEIPPVVFEELLVNALVHRDYLISAPIRLFVYSDRVEIISPGTLPNNLTVEKIRAGNSNLRNPILASFVAKGLMPYRGLGSGVVRALEAWPDIEFRDDRDAGLFVVTVRRAAPGGTPQVTPQVSPQVTPQVTPQVDPHVRALLERVDGEPTRAELQALLGLSDREHFRKAYLGPALEAGFVERTRPDAPNSRDQRYRITASGAALRGRLAKSESRGKR